MNSRNYQILLKLTFSIIDLCLITISFLAAWKLRFFNVTENNNQFGEYYYILVIALFIWLVLIIALDLMHVPRTTQRINNTFWNYLIYPQFILVSFLFLIVIFFNYDYIPRLFLIYYIIFQFLCLTVSKFLRSKIYQKLRISGVDYVGLGLVSHIENLDIMNKWLKNNTKKGFHLKNLDLKNIYVNNLKDTINLVDNLKSGDYLIIDLDCISKKDYIKIKEISENKAIHIYKLIKNNVSLENHLDFKKVGPFNLIKSRRINVKNPINIINKRIFDFIFSLIFISFIYWWVYIIVSLIVKFQSKGPVIFKQLRVGLDGENFMCYKFRTMHIDSTNSKKITEIGDSRIFTFGNFMRKTNIDEFPQFINVLKGNMSVVGPRPHMVTEDDVLANKIEKYRMRRWVKPGITGYAAMKGFRGGTESVDLMQRRIDLDVDYIEKWSFLLDIRICFDTVLEIIFLKKKGH